MFRPSRLSLIILCFGVLVTLALTLTGASGPNKTLLTAVNKNGKHLELRSEGRMLKDKAFGRVMLAPKEAPPAIPGMRDEEETPLRGPNVQVNNPALDNTQIFPGFPPFLHFTQSETTVAAQDHNIVVSYNNSAGVTESPNPSGPGLVFTRIEFSGYSFSNDGGKTWTSGFVPAAPGVGPFTFGDGVVVVDRRGNFYYASLGATADGHGAVTVNVSSDGGRTFGPGVIAGVDDGSDKNWIGVGPDPNHPGRDNVYVTWTSFTSTGSELAFAVSKDGGHTFQSKIIFAPGPDPDPTHPQNLIQFTNPVVDRSNGRLYIPFAHFSNSNTDFLQMLVSDDAGKTFRFVHFDIPGALDPTLVPLVQPGTFEDCGSGGLRLAIIEGNDIGGGQFGLPRFVQSARLVVQPETAAENGNVYLAYNSSDSPFFGDPSSGSNIFVIHSTDGGRQWSLPQQVNPTVAGDTRHVHPAIAIEDGGEQVDISYYTQHSNGSVDLDLVSARADEGALEVSRPIRITSQSFNLAPTLLPIPIPSDPFQTQNYDFDIVPCYNLGEYNGLFARGSNLYAVWGDDRNLVTEPVNALDPLSGITHTQEDTFFQKVRPQD